MTGKQIAALLVGFLAVVGLGVVAYKQLSDTITPVSERNIGNQEVRQQAQTKEKQAEAQIPTAPDAIVDDIEDEAELDNLALSDEELGELSELEAEGNSVSDFGNVYEEQ